MTFHRYNLIPAFVAGIVGLAASDANAFDITPIDLNSIVRGAQIEGPVGPTVETTFINANGDGIGDLISSVSCPAGFTACLPPQNSAGTIYTYIHTVRPGEDLPNDLPFPSPATTLPLDNTQVFNLTFAVEGFNDVAGFDFGQALSAGVSFTVQQLADKTLSWQVSSGSWDSREPISFFWQTTQPPSGPGGVYSLANADLSGLARGPLPTPIATTTPDDVAIPEGPVSLISTVIALGGLLAFTRYRKAAK